MTKDLGEYKNYIFDMDGTLYFNPPVIKRLIAIILGYYIFHPWMLYQLGQWMKYIGYEKKKNAKGFSPTVYKWLVVKLSKIIPKYEDKRITNFIKRQHSLGKKIYIYSNVPLIEKISALKLHKHIDNWFCPDGENITTLKPDSAGLEYIMKKEGLKKEETIFIGDRFKTDGKCAVNAGVECLILPKKQKQREKLKELFF
ncbi:MAG: HAD-IA family hydrolase [Christensenellaceae bacterium]|jgi:HAD superfamily hydrolase (TIGR01549 family)|nr:HAD-IA family hydrolase [Christensenellaceae bacterium]